MTDQAQKSEVSGPSGPHMGEANRYSHRPLLFPAPGLMFRAFWPVRALAVGGVCPEHHQPQVV